MKKIAKIFLLLLIAFAFTTTLVACDDNNDTPINDVNG